MTKTGAIETWLAGLAGDPTGRDGLFPFMLNKRAGFDPAKDWVYYAGPYWDQSEITAAIFALLHGRWLSAGPAVSRFEAGFSKAVGVARSVMVNSGSSANLVAVTAMKRRFGWQDGDEVLVAAVGFPTTTAPIVQNNLRPVFVDVVLDDLNLDLADLERKITPRTKAVFLSPALGNPPDLDALAALAERHGFQLMIDACDSLGTTWRGRPLQTYGAVSTCSFYPAHHITTGEGGMVSSDDAELLKIARSLVNWGRDCHCEGTANVLPNGTCNKRFDRWLPGSDRIVDHKYVYTQIGYNLKPLDLQGAIGTVQLGKLPEIVATRRANKQAIGEIITRHVPGSRVPTEIAHAETSWFAVPIVCDDPRTCAALVAHLETNRIQTRTYFGGNLLAHPAYAHLGDRAAFPVAEKVLDHAFFVGSSPTITAEMIAYIERVVAAFAGRRAA